MANGACSVFAIDVDGDGDVDLLSAAMLGDAVALHENDGSQSFTEHVLTNSADAIQSVFAIDVDGDGDVDALGASYNDDTVAWYENDCATLPPTVTPLPTHVSHSTLVAHYSFDDGAAAEDSDGSLDGTVSGATATTGPDGSGALSFDGTDDYVEFPAEATADVLGSAARTVCLWAVIDEWDEGTLFSYDSNDVGRRFGFMTETTAGEFRVLGYGASYDVLNVAVTGSDDGGWHQYCHTYDGTDWLLYFDGTLVHTVTVALDTGSDNPLTLGVRMAGYTGFLSGSIDEVHVYSSALDAASIQVLYDAVTLPPSAAPSQTRAPMTPTLAPTPRAPTVAPTAPPGTLELGRLDDVYMDGVIDELYVYATALTADEVQWLFDALTSIPSIAPSIVPRPCGNSIFKPTSMCAYATVFCCASRTRREQSTRPKVSQIDFELESFEVWSGPPEPVVEFHTGAEPASHDGRALAGAELPAVGGAEPLAFVGADGGADGAALGETIAVAYGPAIECSVPGAGAEAELHALAGSHGPALECSEPLAFFKAVAGAERRALLCAEPAAVSGAFSSSQRLAVRRSVRDSDDAAQPSSIVASERRAQPLAHDAPLGGSHARAHEVPLGRPIRAAHASAVVASERPAERGAKPRS